MCERGRCAVEGKALININLGVLLEKGGWGTAVKSLKVVCKMNR